MKRRQVEVRVPHERWDPRRRKVRIAAGVGLWDKGAGRYLLPQAAADEDTPGGAGSASDPAAFFNVALRRREPFTSPTEGLDAIANASWWRDRAQGTTLAAGDISRFATKVNFGKLRRRVRDDRGVPKRGPINRIHASHFELAQGADFSHSCLSEAATCPGQYQGRLQPYALYVPKKKRRPRGGWGLTLLLHSLSATYNQYSGTRNQSQLGERGAGSLVVTTLSRGPDESYENYGAADVFEVWADVARHYRLDPAWASIAGYSMGGVGTFKLGAQFPDLFARAFAIVGNEANSAVLASLRNIPVLMWNNHGDELINDAFFNATALSLDELGYRYELDAFQPCAHPDCSALFPNHLQLAINDQYAPAARFLGRHVVDRNPHHVTYVVDAERNHANLRLVGDHAYWVSGVKLRDTGAGQGEIDAFSRGLGRGDPSPSLTQVGTGELEGGNFGTLTYDRRAKTWGSAPGRSRANRIDIEATNVAKATINVERAQVNCDVKLNIKSDGPIAVTLRGCNRTVTGA
jgi:pimeloyl-ACP methyl ester carboxylesterase